MPSLRRVAAKMRFLPGTLLMSNADGTVLVEPYSDLNPPETLMVTEFPATSVATPPAGQATLFTPDGASLQMKDDAGTVITVGPSAGGGGGATGIASQAYLRLGAAVSSTSTTYAQITPLTFSNLVASTNYFLSATLFYTTAATSTGIGIGINGTQAMAAVNGTVQIAESLTAVRNGGLTGMNTNLQGIAGLATPLVARVDVALTTGSTGGGNLYIQFNTEVGGSAANVLAGSFAVLTRF